MRPIPIRLNDFAKAGAGEKVVEPAIDDKVSVVREKLERYYSSFISSTENL